MIISRGYLTKRLNQVMKHQSQLDESFGVTSHPTQAIKCKEKTFEWPTADQSFTKES
jgi:hypothetical protein